jgi:branched-chain amino acid transport system ATP-binding protein
MAGEAILEVKNINTFIGQFHILEGVSVSVPKGSITVLLGRNGAGKTTTLKSIMGMTPPRDGAILFEGESLVGKRPYTIAQMGIGYVPEHRAIFKELTVRENLEIAERKRGDLARRTDFIFELFPDLKRLYSLPGGNLSGGQQQITACS